MTARAYYEAMMSRLERLGREQLPAIERAGAMVAEAIGGGHRAWVAKTTHCLHDELTFRAGGLMAIHILDDPIAIEAGDVVLIGTNAGTTFLTVETARIARERGATSIALTQLPYETDPAVIAEHPSGKKLYECADLVIDLGGQTGDGELTSPDGTFPIIPGSGVAVVLAGWMIVAEAVARLAAAGQPPLLWQSMQVTGATARNTALLAAYHSTHVGYQTDGDH
ncbi:MAG TPA: hypothetical protein VH482_35645 [Thermomicrobiales bacterium]|jgi:uncharacterized phosphosugar-binding protein